MLEFTGEGASGLVKCELIDCKEKQWSFQGKPALFTKEEVSAETTFPLPGVLPCKIEAKRLDNKGKMVFLVHTVRWKVENAESGGYFEVYEDQVVDL